MVDMTGVNVSANISEKEKKKLDEWCEKNGRTTTSAAIRFGLQTIGAI